MALFWYHEAQLKWHQMMSQDVSSLLWVEMYENIATYLIYCLAKSFS
jgi:hypothetical protein